MKRGIFWLLSALVGASAWSGCLDGGDGLSVSFTTDWSEAGPNYRLLASAALPAGFSVILTDETTGASEEIPLERLGAPVGYAYPVPATLPLEDGHVYRLEGRAGDHVVGVREIVAADGGLGRSAKSVTATFDMVYELDEVMPSGPMSTSLQGEYRLQSSPSVCVGRFSGTGDMTIGSDGIEMQVQVTKYKQEMVDRRLTVYELGGKGTWRFLGYGDTEDGRGDVTVATQLTGRQMKADADGVDHLTEQMHTLLIVDGVLYDYGDTAKYRYVSEYDMWTRVDTGAAIWIAGTDETRITPANGTLETSKDHYDEAAAPEDAEPTMTARTTFTGLRPLPLATGDRFTMDGIEGGRIRYVVFEGETREVLGQNYETVEVVGTATSGVTGSETRVQVADGEHAGLTLEWTQRFAYEQSRIESRLTIKEIEGGV